MELNFKNVLIFGYGVSGHAVEDVLFENKINYKIHDMRIDVDGNKFIKKLDKNILRTFDLIVVSPGVSYFNKYVQLALKLNIKVVSEIEFASFYCNKKIIAITGTNGKTTTSKLIYHILKNNNANVELLGNVGTPFCKTFKSNAEVSVVEVSSFQLELVDTFRPNIAILLNVDSDHLDRHKTQENYTKCKFELFKNQEDEDIAIVPLDSQLTNYTDKIKAKKYFFSKNSDNFTDKIRDGIYIENEDIYVVNNKIKSKLCNKDEFAKISTSIDNILVSILACLKCGLKLNDIIESIKTFKVDPQKLEVVKIVNGVTYINDSKATNIHATKYALETLKDKGVFLLLGGYDKKLDYTDFFSNVPKNVVKILLFGSLAKRLKKCCKKCKFKNYVEFKSLLMAINFAKAQAYPGSVVLLSPSSSSFDEFLDYKKRGEFFVNNI